MVRMDDNAQTIESSVAEQQTLDDLDEGSNPTFDTHNAGMVNNNTVNQRTSSSARWILYVFFFQY